MSLKIKKKIKEKIQIKREGNNNIFLLQNRKEKRI